MRGLADCHETFDFAHCPNYPRGSARLVCRQSAPADKRLPLAGSRMAHLLFERCEPVTQHHQSFVLCLDFVFLRFDLRLLLPDLSLLFFEGVDEDGAEAIVLDAFDLTFFVAGNEQWL